MIKLTKVVSGYLPPEDGPFECENCHYFDSPHSCELVSGRIDPEGCCNLYTEKDKQEKTDEKDDSDSIDIGDTDTDDDED